MKKYNVIGISLLFLILLSSCSLTKNQGNVDNLGNLSQQSGLFVLNVQFLETRNATNTQLLALKTTISHGVEIFQQVTPETEQTRFTWEVEGGVSKDINETKINPEIKDPNYKGNIIAGEEIYFVSRTGKGVNAKYIYKNKHGYMLHFVPNNNFDLVLSDVTNLSGSFYTTNFSNIVIQFGHKIIDRTVSDSAVKKGGVSNSSGLQTRTKN